MGGQNVRKMDTKEENLNIEYNTKILVREALRRYGSAAEASKYLEVSDRTVFRYMDKFNLDKNGRDTKRVQGCYKIDSFIPGRPGANGFVKRY